VRRSASYSVGGVGPSIRARAACPRFLCGEPALLRGTVRPLTSLYHLYLWQVPVDVIKEVCKIVEIIKVIEVPIIKEVILGKPARFRRIL